MDNQEYKIYFYKDISTGKMPVKEYIDQLSAKDRAKVLKYIEFLRINKGYLDEPYSRHIKGKIRELRVSFGRNRHRIFYFTFLGAKIILLHASYKKTAKTPVKDIETTLQNYQNFIDSYEQK